MIYLILIFGFLCRSSIYKYYKIQITEKYSTDMKIWHEHRWGLMTITTVGYDLNPRTLLGFDFKKILWWNIVLGCTGSDQAFFGQLRFQENWLEGSALSPGFSFSPCPFLSWWTALLSSTRTDSGETRWGRSWCWRSSSPSWLASVFLPIILMAMVRLSTRRRNESNNWRPIGEPRRSSSSFRKCWFWRWRWWWLIMMRWWSLMMMIYI